MPIQNFKKIVKKLVGSSSIDVNSHKNTFRLDDREVKNLRLLQRSNSDTLGKVGMLSWTGEMDGSLVKVYECRSEAQAKFIEELSLDVRVAKYLPRCHHRKNEFLVVEWVEGKSVSWKALRENSDLMKKMSGVHADMHSIHIDYWPNEKCYFFDYLESRYDRFKNVLPLDNFAAKVFHLLSDEMSNVKASLSHPDITPVNVVVDNLSGEMKVIDNDLFTHNTYYLIDIFIVHRSIGSVQTLETLKQYLLHYVKQGGDLSPLVDYEDFFNALWTYRVVGTCLQEDKIQQGLDIADHFLQGSLATHPVIDLVKNEKLF